MLEQLAVSEILPQHLIKQEKIVQKNVKTKKTCEKLMMLIEKSKKSSSKMP